MQLNVDIELKLSVPIGTNNLTYLTKVINLLISKQNYFIS